MSLLAQLLARLPRVGEATAQRLAAAIAEQPDDWRRALAREVSAGAPETRCPVCCDTLGEDPCACEHGDRGTILVVTTPQARRVLTRAWKGRYHVLGGLVPDGGAEGIRALLERCRDPMVTDLILAFGPGGKARATEIMIANALRGTAIDVWATGRGIAFGRELEWATDQEIVESLTHRVPA